MYCEISDDMHHGFTFIPIDAIQEDCTELFGGALSIKDIHTDNTEVQLRMQTITTDEVNGAFYATNVGHIHRELFGK